MDVFFSFCGGAQITNSYVSEGRLLDEVYQNGWMISKFAQVGNGSWISEVQLFKLFLGCYIAIHYHSEKGGKNVLKMSVWNERLSEVVKNKISYIQGQFISNLEYFKFPGKQNI